MPSFESFVLCRLIRGFFGHSLVQESGLGIAGLLPLRGFPHDHGILAGFGEGQLTKPSHTVHIVTVNVSCREGGEVDRDSRKTPAAV